MKRRNVLSLLLGLLIGIAAGITYSWVINPISYSETTPYSLRPQYRQEYFLLTALSYSQNGDLMKAEERLASFSDLALPAELSRLAQQNLSQERPVAEARALAQLAAALSGSPTEVSAGVTATTTPSPTSTSSPPTTTPSPVVTQVPTSTPGAPYALLSQEVVCDPDRPDPLLMVVVEDANGAPIPGVEVQILWDSGQDRFFTGLKPELGAGYGDFTMTPGVIYQVELTDGQVPITNLQSGECTDQLGQPYPGSIELLFQQPSP